MFLKAEEKSFNVSLANIKADTSSAFNKPQLYFHWFDVDCHNPPPKKPAVESSDICFLLLQAPADRYALSKITEVRSGLY